MRQNKIFLSNTKKENKGKETIEPKKIKTFSLTSHRLSNNLSENSKLNIYNLLKTDPLTSSIPGTTFENLLIVLYGNSEFVKSLESSNWPKQMLEEIRKTAKTRDPIESLDDLRPQNEKYKIAFYKMLKGSGFYDLKNRLGHPPLSDFVSLQKNNKTAVNFNYASLPVLQALLGDQVATSILQKEKIKSESKGGRRVLSKTELLALLKSSPENNKNTTELEQMLSFSKK
ncbi:MAG: hypothetical protein FJZ57_06035, partial [Chlamydiae bacterium]|nr:hypothetical protein [Chlamydiota bacterium]